jgi:cysteine desulfurase
MEILKHTDHFNSILNESVWIFQTDFLFGVLNQEKKGYNNELKRGVQMIYLDYSATTPVSDHVLASDRDFHKQSFANPNSIHRLGKEALNDIQKTSHEIQEILGCSNHEVTYTSGATESNNMALKGIAYHNRTLGNHIITTPFEHGSIVTTLNYLSKQGFDIDVVGIDEDGLVDLEDLKSLLTDQTILVSIGLVNSELGIVQDLKGIKKCIKAYPQIILHSDMTQAIGKVKVDYEIADLISLSAHKIYGFKGIGALLHRKDFPITPVIHGGKSWSVFRGGTPPTSLIHSLGVAIKDAYEHLDEHREHIQALNDYLVKGLLKIKGCMINSNAYAVPHIINFSLVHTKANKLQDYLSENDVFVSTTSACSSDQPMSRVVYALTEDLDRAQSSIRVSLSHLTRFKEIDRLLELLEDYHESC